MSDKEYEQPLLPVLQERYQCPHFRVLVTGRANAGKTTILKKVCQVGDDTKPIVYDRKGKKIDTWWSRIKYLSPEQGRGEHDIEHQITYPGSNFIFHDSRGFEAGSRNEMVLARQFLDERSTKAADMQNRVHVIWYCIPMDDARIIADAELDFFQHSTGEVPVVVVFTKFDARIVQEYSRLPKELDKDESEKWKLAAENANRTLQDIYIPRVNNTPHPPAGIVHLEDMHKEDKQCAKLTEKTAEVINDTTLRRLFVSVQKNNIKLCIKEAINGMVSDILQQPSSPNWVHIAFSAMCYFPHCWNTSWKYDHKSGIMRLGHGDSDWLGLWENFHFKDDFAKNFLPKLLLYLEIERGTVKNERYDVAKTWQFLAAILIILEHSSWDTSSKTPFKTSANSFLRSRHDKVVKRDLATFPQDKEELCKFLHTQVVTILMPR